MEVNEARLTEAHLRRRLVLLAAGSSCLPRLAGAAGAEKAPVEVQVSHVRILHHFSGGDGWGPQGGLTQAWNGWLYGCTERGGAHGDGALYSISTNGRFVLQGSLNKKGGGGRQPGSALRWAGYLFGTTVYGGSAGYGTVFRIERDGSPVTLHDFAGPGADGAYPMARLVQGRDFILYGTTYSGGQHSAGSCYSMTSGGVMTQLYSFEGGHDGSFPSAGLVQGSDGNFYGTTMWGGHGRGTVFRLDAAGNKTTLYRFGDVDDGSNPQAELVEGPDGLLYGTTWNSVFRLRKDGRGFKVLRAFVDATDGAELAGPLLLARDGYFYGTARAGGDAGLGTLFRLDAGGHRFKRLHSFSGADGARPECALVQPGVRIYGTTLAGGASNLGAVFRLRLG